jgi:hypothetical protein
MPELDEDLVKELREQLDAEKKERDELIEELRSSRKPEPEPEAKPSPSERLSGYYKKAAEERRKKAEGGGDDD